MGVVKAFLDDLPDDEPMCPYQRTFREMVCGLFVFAIATSICVGIAAIICTASITDDTHVQSSVNDTRVSYIESLREQQTEMLGLD